MAFQPLFFQSTTWVDNPCSDQNFFRKRMLLLGSYWGASSCPDNHIIPPNILPCLSIMARPVGLIHRVTDSGEFPSGNPFTRYLVTAKVATGFVLVIAQLGTSCSNSGTAIAGFLGKYLFSALPHLSRTHHVEVLTKCPNILNLNKIINCKIAI